MSGGNLMRGWVASYYDEHRPWPFDAAQAEAEIEFGPEFERARMPNANFRIPFFLAEDEILAPHIPAASPKSRDAPTDGQGWYAKDGVIHGSRRQVKNDSASQSRLHYCRPLQSGETISYEFLYDPDKFEVHPALGRLAFLIEPRGVRLHWMTDGDGEWTGLAEDNSVVSPLDRRGPKALPLADGEWNQMTVALADGQVTLSLNEQVIFERKLDPQNDRTFGFYHDASRCAVQVKNVVMRGDWPQRLTPHQFDNLAALSARDRSNADRHALNVLFQDKFLSQRVLEVARHAAGLPDE